jgi:hypothetical protein
VSVKSVSALLLVVVGAALFTPLLGAEGEWCAVYASAEGAKNCYFATHRQCMTDLEGKGGFYVRNVR